ncbi:MAG: hypothetical protein LUE10_00685, partial [Alistipes sp.]|nr:hypothetical protein [Alistipes sp.]
FDRQMEVRQDKKELVEKRIEDLQELYRNINMTVQQGEAGTEQRRILRNSLDVAGNRFNTIVTLLEYLGLDKSFTAEVEELRSLIGRHTRLLVQAKAEGGMFPEEVQLEEERLFNRIDKDASLLVFRISDI